MPIDLVSRVRQGYYSFPSCVSEGTRRLGLRHSFAKHCSHCTDMCKPKLGRRSCASAANDQLRQAESKATGRKRKSAVIRQDRACCFSAFPFSAVTGRSVCLTVHDMPAASGTGTHSSTHLLAQFGENALELFKKL